MMRGRRRLFNTAVRPGLYPRPSLDLKLTRLDNRITFTRSGNATKWDGAGVMKTSGTNVARHDHDPLTGKSLGLLIEGARTNALKRSETFDHADWVKTGGMAVTADQVAAPDGNTTADKLDDTSANQDQVFQNATVADDSATRIWSVFMKAGTSSNVSMNLNYSGGSGTDAVAIFDLANGVALPTTGGAAPDDAGIVDVGGGWYRCWVEQANNGSGNTTARCYIHPAHSATFEEARDNSYTGDAYAWGAQLEAGDFPSSYIATTGASATRAEDVPVMTAMSWFNQNTGTWVPEWSNANLHSTIMSTFTVSDGTGSNAHEMRRISSKMDYGIVVAGSQDGNADSVGDFSGDGTLDKAAMAYAVNDLAGSLNGEAVVTDASLAALPAVTQLNLGIQGNESGRNLFGHLRRLRFWPGRLPNGQLVRPPA